MNISPINNNLSSKAPVFQAKKIYYTELKKIPNLNCACCGKKTINPEKLHDAYCAITKPISTLIKKGCFKKLENIQEIYDKLLYLAVKYPDYSLDKILNNPSERYDLKNQITQYTKLKLKENEIVDQKQIKSATEHNYKGVLNCGRAEIRSSSAVMKRLASFKEYLDGEKLATFEQLEIYAKKYPRKTIGEILRMEEIYNFHRTKDFLQRAETREKLDYHYSNILDMVKKLNPDAENTFAELKKRTLELVGMQSTNERLYNLKKIYAEELEKHGCEKIKDKVFAEIENMPATFNTKDSFLVYAVNHNYNDIAIIESLLNPYVASFEHIIPKHNQGADDINNGIVMCRRCNQVRERESYVEFIKYNPMMPYNTQKQVMQIADYILNGRLNSEYDFYPIKVAQTLEEYSEGTIKPDVSEYCKRRAKKLEHTISESASKIREKNIAIHNKKAERAELLKKLAELEDATNELKAEKAEIIKEHVYYKDLSSQIKDYLEKNQTTEKN